LGDWGKGRHDQIKVRAKRENEEKRNKKRNNMSQQRIERLEAELSKPRVMLISQEEMEAQQVPRQYRDYCAHLLVPLNRCRQECFYLPWKCTHERHAYAVCQYQESVRRKKVAQLAREKEKLKGEDNPQAS